MSPGGRVELPESEVSAEPDPVVTEIEEGDSPYYEGATALAAVIALGILKSRPNFIGAR